MTNVAELTRIIQSEAEQALALRSILAKEYDALCESNIDALAELAEQKTVALEQLRQHAAARMQWLADHNIVASREALEHEALRNDSELRAQWLTLADLYEDNRKQSDVLSNLVLMAQKRTQQQIHILRGADVTQSDTYDAQGSTKTRNVSHGNVVA